MKICMLGAGAMGCTVGGTLALGGSEVILVDTWKEHVNAINKNGLRMLLNGEDVVVKNVTAKTDCIGMKEVDLVIVFTKSYNTRVAIEAAKNIVGKNTLVISMQNGMGNDDILAEVVGAEHIVYGKTYTGGSILEPGYSKSTVKGKITYIGEKDGSTTQRVQRIADMFNAAGMETIISDNMIGLMWDKLLVTIAGGGLCVIIRLPYGPLNMLPELKEVGMAGIQEGINVAKANKVKLTTENPEEIWDKKSAGLPWDFRPSMLQSIDNGNRTEVDFINGSIVREGKKVGIPTPINQTIVACVHGIEAFISGIYEKNPEK